VFCDNMALSVRENSLSRAGAGFRVNPLEEQEITGRPGKTPAAGPHRCRAS
jgi:hypothetical protein